MKILLLDIETSPNLAFVWGIWEQNIRLDQMITASSTMCWAAKWLGDSKVMFDSVHKSNVKSMLKGIHALLDEADVVVHYNGKKFDVPTLNKEFLMHDIQPPSPYRQIDMLQVARGTFRFQSNKLDFVTQQLGIGAKVKHAGFQLWIDCMNKDPLAWKKMEKYNRGDVTLLEKLYLKMRPWIKNHPNHGLYNGSVCCPRCGGNNLQSRGVARSVNVTYRRYQCKDCGGWAKGDKPPTHVKPLITGINN